MFHGSYRKEDVQFLLKPIQIQPIDDTELKERLIQTGQKHYSEMICPERLPSAKYMALFHKAVQDNRMRMARDALVLAASIARRGDGPITLVSLARAGTPVGVILYHLLLRRFGRKAAHYSISIIRDRGIDTRALDFILEQHDPASVFFIDGWTGKGVIARELRKCIAQYNAARGTSLSDGLHVLSDLCGAAHCAASAEDYLIPSSILNATISGLVSRSILNEQMGTEDFHGCVYYEDLLSHDLSVWFAEQIIQQALSMGDEVLRAAAWQPHRRLGLQTLSGRYVEAAMMRYGIDDVNLIKPGIGEATRVLLRRVPRAVVLREPDAPEVAHLKVLAAEKDVPIAIDLDLPYRAVSLIRSASDA